MVIYVHNSHDHSMATSSIPAEETSPRRLLDILHGLDGIFGVWSPSFACFDNLTFDLSSFDCTLDAQLFTLEPIRPIGCWLCIFRIFCSSFDIAKLSSPFGQ